MPNGNNTVKSIAAAIRKDSSSVSSIKVLVAAHKPYWMPGDSLYLPVQVGSQGKDTIDGYQRDDQGLNISFKNPHYCELTALYWGWRNLDSAHLGLAHYRRHFRGLGERGTLSSQEAACLLSKAPVVLPTLRKYYIETIEKHYGHTFDPTHIEYLRGAIESISPSYIDCFNRHMSERSAHMFNMQIMRRDLLDEYCTWLFDVLEYAERSIDYTNMTFFEARAVGRLSELLLDTWIDRNNVPYVECPVVNMEGTNWAKKGASFLSAKFMGKKYIESF